MQRVIAIFMLLFLLLTLFSCRVPEMYSLMQDVDDVSEIAIVHRSFNSTGDMLQQEICKISNPHEFWSHFNEIPCYTYFGDPAGVVPEREEGNAIRINYSNGDYELINWNGQSKYIAQKGLTYYAGYSIFDEEEFFALLNYYLCE